MTVGCLALGGYVVLQVPADPTSTTMAWWFAGAVIAHDLILFPAYTFVDRTARAVLGSRPATVNYLRVPTLASGLLFLLFFPGILEQGRETLLAATGHGHQPYLSRWLVLTAIFFTTSAALYGSRSWRLRRKRRPQRT
ncbi:hypothetical protein [Amycolatopsis sp. 195334CR]|uniref:hypothetical protein n=1 Tax=Amycolatopsis sp. 195334CR TaxID=2814588 RepID=UPI001A8C1210|nr:hypothetical protein [Amycolatopsis sp. 195334CR]MBN6038484.1 hypothetical protein [Amycolatopsis sp. 195334CR]